MKRKQRKLPALKRKAAELAKPLYARPKAQVKIKETTALRAEHVAQQAAIHRKNEHSRLTGFINSSLSPGVKNDLMAARAKL